MEALLEQAALHQPLDSERESSRGFGWLRSAQGVSTQNARTEEPGIAGWNRIIEQLQVWHRDPSMLDFDDVSAPSRVLLWQAVQLARNLRDAEWPPFDHVVPTVDGGVSFERRSGSRFRSLEMEPSGEARLTTFENGRMLSRLPLHGHLALSV